MPYPELAGGLRTVGCLTTTEALEPRMVIQEDNRRARFSVFEEWFLPSGHHIDLVGVMYLLDELGIPVPTDWGKAAAQQGISVTGGETALFARATYTHNCGKLHSSGDQKKLVGLSAMMQCVKCFAVALCHCNNVKIVAAPPRESEVPVTPKPRQVFPDERWYVLAIEQRKERKAPVEGTSAERFERALHICRGHFMKSGIEGRRKLFNKLVGTFWVPEHVRGTISAGTVHKDYEIK